MCSTRPDRRHCFAVSIRRCKCGLLHYDNRTTMPHPHRQQQQQLVRDCVADRCQCEAAARRRKESKRDDSIAAHGPARRHTLLRLFFPAAHRMKGKLGGKSKAHRTESRSPRLGSRRLTPTGTAKPRRRINHPRTLSTSRLPPTPTMRDRSRMNGNAGCAVLDPVQINKR